MRHFIRSIYVVRFGTIALMVLCHLSSSFAQDWPQWRGVHGDGKVSGFKPPTPWPAALTPKWRAPVGAGDATPAFVGDRVFAFGRLGDEEMVRCLDAADGKEIWRYAYPAVAVTGAAEKYQGPRSSPAVAEGKIITLGVGGILTCLDAATGKIVWKKEEFTKDLPMFFTSTSPLVVDGVCLVHLGGKDTGVFVAIEAASGKLRWQWTGAGPSYSSPAILSGAGGKQIVLLTESDLTGLSLQEGKRLWTIPTTLKPGYWNSASPVVEGQTIYYSGQGDGTRAVRIQQQSGIYSAKEMWHNRDVGTVYNTPVVKDGFLYGISDRGNFFCLDSMSGLAIWSSTNRVSPFCSILDTGAVLMALPEKSGLIAFKPSRERFEEVARLSVSSTPVYAHPVLVGNRIYVRDAESVALFMLD